MTNKFPAPCATCGNLVAVNAGTVQKENGRWVVTHLACAEAGQPAVMKIRTSGGSFTRNRRGRCEDAPCCGCCTI